MNQYRRPLLMFFVSVLVGPLAGCACPKVKKPASDSTPPTISWTVRNESTNTSQTLSGDASLQVKKGDHYVVTMTAADSGGVNEATLAGEVSWSCRQGSVASNAGPGLESPQTEKHDEWPSEEVCSEIKLSRDQKLDFQCQSGYQFQGGLVRLTGTGKNFYNGLTNAKLTMTVSP